MEAIGLYEAMSTLRAVRRLRPDPIPDDVLARVLRAATWAPSGGNRQPWRIIAVRERALLEALGALYAGSWAAYASHAREGFSRLPEEVAAPHERTLRAGDHLAEHFAETPAVLIFCFNPKHLAVTDAGLDRVSVVGGGSVYPAVQNTLLACRAEGLGAVLTTLLCQHEPAVRNLLEIPEPWATAAAVPIGFPVGRGHGPITRRATEEMVYADLWNRTIEFGPEA
jgi:nitroreductase